MRALRFWLREQIIDTTVARLPSDFPLSISALVVEAIGKQTALLSSGKWGENRAFRIDVAHVPQTSDLFPPLNSLPVVPIVTTY